MPKKDKQGSYELVDSQSFGKDLESNVTASSDDVFPQSVDSTDANLLANKFDTITSPTRSRFSFKGVKRRKYLVIFLILVVIWITGAAIYTTSNGIDVLDYYKTKISGDKNPEVENPQGDKMVYNDNDEPLTEEAAKNQNNGKPPAQQQDKKPEKPNDQPVYDDQDGTPKQEDESSNDKDKAKDKPDDKTDDKTDEKTEEKTDGKTDEKTEEKPSGALDPTKFNKRQKITLEALRSGKFYVYETDLRFLEPPAGQTEYVDEGLHISRSYNKIVAEKGTDKSFRQVLLPNFEFTYADKKHKVFGFYPNYDLTQAIVVSDVEHIYRHSSTGYYWIYNIETKTYTPLITNEGDSIVKVSLATWSPKYNYVSFVHDNNLYVKDLKKGTSRKITNDGSKTILNGKTGWVYEEEVLADDQAFWWSPDESRLIFLRTDEGEVPKYNIDYYVQDSSGGSKYPVTKEIPYPKPGFKNPKVSMKIFTLENDEVADLPRPESGLGDEYIVYEALFLDEENFLIKESDRESNILDVRHFNPTNGESKIVYSINAGKEYQGWIEKFIKPIPIPPKGEGVSTWGYVDVIVVDGYNHLVYFESATTEKPKVLTSGNWEVLNSELAYNKEKGTLYFAANKRASTDKHIYSINLETEELADFTDNLEPAYYDALFSPRGKYVSLKYEGPETPSQCLYKVEGMMEVKQLSIPTNLELSKRLYDFPTKNIQRVKVQDKEDETPVELNVIEYLPPNFDESKKYPLLVHFYAGPGSQVVTSRSDVSYVDVVSSSLDAVILYIEPRGTGGQGWKYRSWAKKKIGYWEPRDITQVTKQWLKKKFIDTERTALWGWSYGGFTTLKTLEYDGGETFKYGMAVAPVTNWLFYDSIYTERYMDKPENNEEGYKISQISNMDNLKKAKRFLVMHGTADDNVHIQNTYSLLDQLDLSGAENYDVHIFPDSDHSIYHHNANIIIYDKLYSWLKDAFQGDFDSIGN